jgi:hypothetical protein
VTLVGVGFVPTASASLVPGSPIPVGANITVFHNLDFVATTGWSLGEPLTIEVLRNGVVIGSVTAPALVTPEGVGLEVNHGPAGTAVDGDCWEGITPDIRPGDTVRVTHDDGVSAVVVDDIRFTGPAVEDPDTGDVLVKGVANFADGSPIPLARLDSAEFRDDQFRGAPNAVEEDPAVPGGFVMRYLRPYNLERNRDNLDEAQRKASLLDSGGHAIGFGHVEPLPAEAMLVEGIADVPGPALGCESAPSAGTHAIGGLSPSVINLENASSGVSVSGVTGGTSVEVTLSDGTHSISRPADVDGGTWSTGFDSGQLEALEGTVTVTAAHAPTAGAPALNSRTLLRDVVAPAPPTAVPNGGSFEGSKQVVLSPASAGDGIYYTVGDGSQAAPTAIPRLRYTAPFSISESRTVKAIAFDAAGNPSPTVTLDFVRAVPTPPVVTPPIVTPPVITVPPGGGTAAIVPLSPSIGKAKPGRRGGEDTATARWRAPVANGAVLTGYEIRALKLRPGRSAKKRPPVAVGSDARKLEMSLRAGKYRFQVRAVSAAGKSPWSERSAKVRAR